jgi:hypothetical protein
LVKPVSASLNRAEQLDGYGYAAADIGATMQARGQGPREGEGSVMIGKSKPAFGLAIAVVCLLAASVPSQAIVLGGKGAPQSEACKAAGGTENGQMCVLESGQACQSMALARDNACLDEEGNLVEEGPDVGSNLPPDESGGDDSGSDE